MIHVITKANRHLYERQLEEHFRIRYDIYVVERKWMALDRPDRREVDQFDTDDAIYLLALEGDRVVGGTRFVPTLRPHLMSEVFPHLASVAGLQRGPDIVEWTRIFAVPSKRGSDSKTFHMVLAGMMEFCLDEGINFITVVMETWWLPRFLDLKLRARPLGLPEQVEDMLVVATIIEVSEETLTAVKALKNIEGSVLVRRGLNGWALPDYSQERRYA